MKSRKPNYIHYYTLAVQYSLYIISSYCISSYRLKELKAHKNTQDSLILWFKWKSHVHSWKVILVHFNYVNSLKITGDSAGNVRGEIHRKTYYYR